MLINCAAIPRDLISTELFGYEAGSFTGARTKGKPGKFLDAHTGTLFLDEIGDMALDLQAALLCALDTSEIVPVGGTKPIKVDVQVVAATNSQLQDCVRKGTFRRDLYYRLNGAQIWLPPLRERPDKLGLITYLWSRGNPRPGPRPTRCSSATKCSRSSSSIPGRATSASCATCCARAWRPWPGASCASPICPTISSKK